MTKTDLLVEESDRWILQLNGTEVTRCCVDHAFLLMIMHDNDLVTIRIEGPFTISSDKGVSEFDPDGRPAVELGPALCLFEKIVQSFVVWKSGSLSLEFSDGSNLQVDPYPPYEAWELSGPGRLLMIGLPYDGIALWT